MITCLTFGLPTSYEVVLGVGDDAAILDREGADLLVATCDTQVEDTHFRLSTMNPYDIGQRALAVNVSDIAAMGAQPRFALISLLGSGTLEQDGPFSIVAMKKEEQTRLMHHHRLGKRQHHVHKTGQTLPQCVIPALDMGGFSRLFSHRGVLLLRDHRTVRRPEVREAQL